MVAKHLENPALDDIMKMSSLPSYLNTMRTNYHGLVRAVFGESEASFFAGKPFVEAMREIYDAGSHLTLHPVKISAATKIIASVAHGGLLFSQDETPQKAKIVLDALDKLQNYQKELLSKRYGIGKYDTRHSIDSVKDAMGTSRSNVPELELKALQALRTPEIMRSLEMVRGLVTLDDLGPYMTRQRMRAEAIDQIRQEATNAAYQRALRDPSVLDPFRTREEMALRTEVSDLGFSTRVTNIFNAQDVLTVADIGAHTIAQMYEWPKFGHACLKDINQRLHENGFPQVEGSPPKLMVQE